MLIREYLTNNNITNSKKVINLMAKLGMGPEYIPVKRKTYKCPKCNKYKAFYKEIHTDTDMNDIVLYCPDCKFSDE